MSRDKIQRQRDTWGERNGRDPKVKKDEFYPLTDRDEPKGEERDTGPLNEFVIRPR